MTASGSGSEPSLASGTPLTVTGWDGVELAATRTTDWPGGSTLDDVDGGLPPEQACTAAVSNSANRTNAPRGINGLDPASEPEVQTQVVVGQRAARMHWIVGDPF